MGAERENLANIQFVVDTDVSYYEVGEVDGAFQKDSLKDYIERFGHERLCAHLAFLQYQVWDTLREINGEKQQDNCKEAVSCVKDN